MKRKILSILLALAILLPLMPVFTLKANAAVSVPAADILNIDFSNGQTADTNGHTLTAGSGEITADTGLGDNVKAYRSKNQSGTTTPVGSCYALTDADYNNLKTSFTVETYFYLTDIHSDQCVFSGQETGGCGFEIWDGKLVFCACYSRPTASKAIYQELFTRRFSANSWIHAAATYDGSTLKLYVNGTLVDSCTDLPDTLVLPYASGFYVGADPDKNGDSQLPLTEGGMVNRARVYSQALSAEQVAALFETVPGRKNAGIAIESTGNTGTVTFGVVSDVHITNYEGTGNNTRLIKALEYFAENGAATTMIAGDVSQSGDGTGLTNYRKTVADAQTGDMTVHAAAGNHDRFVKTDNFAICTYETGWAHYKIDGYHFILISPDDGKDVGDYSSSKQWLAEQLAIAEADTGDRPIFVIAHHAVKNTVFVSDEWYGNLSVSDFSDYPQVVLFTGHSHASNEHPRSIWQDEFTAVNTATLSRVDMSSGYGDSPTPKDGKNCSEGLLVKVEGTKVTVTNHDFIRDVDMENQIWTFDTEQVVATGNTSLFPYNTTIRGVKATEPYFDDSARITVDRITMPNVTFTYPQANVGEGVDGDIVYAYRFEIWNSRGELVTAWREWSDFYQSPTAAYRAAAMTQTLGGLEYGTQYNLFVYPIDGFGLEGAPISTTFTTPEEYQSADVFDVNFTRTGAEDLCGHTYTTKGAPIDCHSDYVDGTVAAFDGDDDAYVYEFTTADYDKIKNSFSFELYYKPSAVDKTRCPFSGQCGGGIGFETCNGKLCLYARFNGDWTAVEIPVKVNVWNHVLVTYDGTALKGYLNDSLVATVAQTGSLQMPDSEQAYKMVIGADINSGTVIENPQPCEVAYARIFSTAISPKADILNVDFRTGSNTDATGKTPVRYNTPTISADDTLKTDVLICNNDGYGYVLADSDYDRIRDSFTAEMYYYTSNMTSGQCPFSGQESGGFGFENTNRKLTFWARFDGGWTQLPTSAKENKWNHVVVTYDGLYLRAYLNGKLDNSIKQTGLFELTQYTDARRVVIGGDTNKTGGMENGTNCKVALARIYSSTLTESEIRHRYANCATAGLVVSSRSDEALPELTYGYSEGSSISYVIQNAGGTAITDISASLTDGSEAFTLSAPAETSLESGKTMTITVTAKNGLAAGSYAGTLQISSSANSITEAVALTVNKATVVVTAVDRVVTVGGTVPGLDSPREGIDYTVTGLANGDTLSTAPGLTYGGSVSTAAPGAVTIKIQGASIANSANYNAIQYRNGILSIVMAETPTANILDVDYNSILGYQDANGKTSTAMGQPVTAYSETVHRTAAVFDASGTGFKYSLTADDYSKIKDKFTIELYYKTDSLTNLTCPFSGQEEGGLGFEHDGTALALWAHIGGSYAAVSIPVTVGEWSHVVVTFDGSKLIAYKNGTQVNTLNCSGSLSKPKYQDAYCMMVGGDTNQYGNLSGKFSGEVALARIYSSTLTAGEISALYGKACMGANASRVPNAEIYGSQEQKMTLTDLRYDPDRDFDAPVTTYSNSLAQISNALAMAAVEETETVTNGKTGFDNLASRAGFTDIRKDSPSSGDPGYATRYYTAETTVMRNGQTCKVLLIAISNDTKDDKYSVSTDFLNKENGNSALKADKAYCITDEADRIYAELSSKCTAIAANSDYIFWVVGTSRGSSVGNELAHKLVDSYGTSHAVAYLFGGMNVSTLAKTSKETSKYNSIFSIVDADDFISYLPLGEDYSGWGFKRWGVTLTIGLPSDSAARTELKNNTEKNYQLYTGSIDRTERTYIDPNYVCYDYEKFSEANGTDIRVVLDRLYAKLPTAAGYYTNTISYYNSSGSKTETVCYDFVTELIDGILDLTEGDTSSFSWSMLLGIWDYYQEIRYSSENDCDVQPLIRLILHHGMHAGSVSAAVGISGLSDLVNLNSKKYVLHEALIHILPENYMSVMSLSEPSAAFISGAKPDAAAVDTLTSGDFSITGQKAFYADQCFTATLTDGVYSLSFGYSDGSPSTLYGNAKLYLAAADDDIESVTYSADNTAFTPVNITYQSDNDRYLVDAPAFNGYFKVKKKPVVIDKPTYPEDSFGSLLTFTYSGEEMTFTPGGFDGDTMTISGNIHTDANPTGYTVSVTPKIGYQWSDGTDAVTFNWIIAKAGTDSFTKTAGGSIYGAEDSKLVVTLPAIPTGASFGSVTCLTANVSGSVVNGKLTVTALEDLRADEFNVTVAVSGGTNYTDYSIIVHVDVIRLPLTIGSVVIGEGQAALQVTGVNAGDVSTAFYVAAYDANGRMLDVCKTEVTITAGTNEISIDCPTVPGTTKYVILAVESTNFLPLCEAVKESK